MIDKISKIPKLRIVQAYIMFPCSKNYLLNSLLILSWASLVILYTFMYNWKQVKNVWKMVTESGNRPPSEPTGWVLLPMLLFIVEKLSHCFLFCSLDYFFWKRFMKKQLCIKNVILAIWQINQKYSIMSESKSFSKSIFKKPF